MLTSIKPKAPPFRMPPTITTSTMIPKPQDAYNIRVDNSNRPFEHIWLQTNEDGSKPIHPVESFSFLDFVDGRVTQPVKKPSPMDSTPFKLVEQVKDLKELAAKLRDAQEIAIDLEHNQYRSYHGLTCLMQISTRSEDFVVDTLKLRTFVGPYLREIFRDPKKKKIMHGADRDVIWLQQDFGIYICNLFDTHQASRVLKQDRNTLQHVLDNFCGVSLDKEYQRSDWRVRPLPAEMIRYAREDTHYLLHLYDVMRLSLLATSTTTTTTSSPLEEVYKLSYEVSKKLCKRYVRTEHSYLGLHGLLSAGLNKNQLAVAAAIYDWRDLMARAEDESPGYILPIKTLLDIAREMPVTAFDLCRLIQSHLPYVEGNIHFLVNIIRDSLHKASAM